MMSPRTKSRAGSRRLSRVSRPVDQTQKTVDNLQAKAELADLRLENLPPRRDCDMENRALSQTPWLTP